MTQKLILSATLTAFVITLAACSNENSENKDALLGPLDPGNIISGIGKSLDSLDQDINRGIESVDEDIQGLNLPYITREPENPEDPNQLLTDPSAAAALGYRIHWQVNLTVPPTSSIQSITPLPNNLLAVVESNNLVTLLDANSGQARWRRQLGTASEVLTLPSIDGAFLVICSEAKAYRLRLTDGSTDREMSLANMAQDTPLLINNHFITGTPTGLVYSQSFNSGIVRWRYQLAGSTMAPVIRDGSNVIATDAQGTVAAINASTGRLIWRRFQPPWARITAQPLLRDSLLYIPSNDQKLYAFDHTTGDVRWSFIAERPLDTPAVAFANRVLLQVPDRGLVALDAQTGQEIWWADTAAQPVRLKGDRLYLLKGNMFTELDFETGKTIQRIAFFRADRVAYGQTTGDDVYLVHNDGRLLKLGPR